ncbi:hypothetical protein TorRG33x02_259110 [Trema orientale]|uniref:Uncharacterized protein n=1 Tax=Trema orientale TaxID=63057 RepID=A0A2P5D883_TREOI|nr:hypothetical protein TorRG33x02_259110 [Trema orientale]
MVTSKSIEVDRCATRVTNNLNNTFPSDAEIGAASESQPTNMSLSNSNQYVVHTLPQPTDDAHIPLLLVLSDNMEKPSSRDEYKMRRWKRQPRSPSLSMSKKKSNIRRVSPNLVNPKFYRLLHTSSP